MKVTRKQKPEDAAVGHAWVRPGEVFEFASGGDNDGELYMKVHSGELVRLCDGELFSPYWGSALYCRIVHGSFVEDAASGC